VFARVFWQPDFLLVHFGRKTNSSKKKTNMSLTDAKVRSLKTRKAQYKVSDSEGMYLLVSPSGGKLWRLAYRFHGKQKSLALGKYPQTSLLEARHARDEAKRLISKGADPSAAKKAEKREKRKISGNITELNNLTEIMAHPAILPERNIDEITRQNAAISQFWHERCHRDDGHAALAHL
jgi:hypothetical protein